MALPSRVRRRFDNDPAELMEFLADEANREEAVMLGLIEKEEPVQPAPAPEGGAPASGGASEQ